MRTVDKFLALDISQLIISWHSNRTTKLTFSNGGEEIASVAVETLDQENIVLRYRFNQTEQIVDSIKVAHRRCHFGGERRWFVCPGCGMPRQILYCARLFRCRVCLGLKFPSQQKNSMERGISRIATQRRMLGGSGSLGDPFLPKPKRMRWKTYARLVEQDRTDRQKYLSSSAAALQRLASAK
jgi:hypothetical protein